MNLQQFLKSKGLTNQLKGDQFVDGIPLVKDEDYYIKEHSKVEGKSLKSVFFAKRDEPMRGKLIELAVFHGDIFVE